MVWLEAWNGWRRARALVVRARYHDCRQAGAAERARAQLLYRRALRVLGEDVAASSPAGADRAWAVRATKLTGWLGSPPLQLARRLRASGSGGWRAQTSLTALALLCLAGLAWCFRVELGLSRNLALGADFRVSSGLLGGSLSGKLTADSGQPFFQSTLEESPSIVVDLGGVRPFSRLRVVNRADCCLPSAVPLVAELSDDGKSWRPLLRRELPFVVLDARLPSVAARFLRLRVDRVSVLHLNEIGVYR